MSRNPKKPPSDDTTKPTAKRTDQGTTLLSKFRSAFLVHDVSRLRRTLFDQRLRPLGLTRSQWWVLANLNLARNESRELSQTELARLLDVGKASLGGIANRLEEAGYIARTQSGDDQRVRQLTVTPEGKRALITIESVGHHLNQAIFEGISAKDLEGFERAIAQMKTNLLNLIDGADPGEE